MFNWEDSSWALPEYCSKYFRIWWNPNKFNSNDYWKLARHCFEYFETWWNPDMFNWEDESWVLPRYCSKFFHIWWNPEKYNVKDMQFLEQYCGEFKDEWMILKVYYSVLL